MSIDQIKSQRELEKSENLARGIEKGMSLLKRQHSVKKERMSQLSRKLEDKEEKMSRHRSLVSELQQKRNEQTLKLNRKFKEIASRNEQRNYELSFQQEYAR